MYCDCFKMKIIGFVILCGLVVCMMAGNASAISDAHKAAIHEHMMNIAMECMKEITLTEDEIMTLKSKKMPDSENARCFVACMFKKSGMMDEDGNMSQEGIIGNAEKIFSDAPEQIDNIKEFLHMCNEVNTLAVSDGAKGCDRAKHAFECMNSHAAKFGFDM